MHLEHEHDCGHTHDHPHTHEPEHAHDHSHTAAPRDELIALMRYMVGHNVSHTNELKELAHKLAHTGDSEACAQILDAVWISFRNERLPLNLLVLPTLDYPMLEKPTLDNPTQ